MIDIHSHILPGIDDGPRALVDSIEIVKELAAQGVTDLIVTPHYVDETNYVSTRKNNAELLAELNKELKRQNLDVRVYLGNEIYINHRIKELIKEGEISTLANSKYLLIELPLNEEYPNYEDLLLDLINSGYKIILAHPERYLITQEDFGILENLYDMGVLFQCNIGSINGKYGRGAKKLAKKMAKKKMIFTFGSDIHHPNRNNYIIKSQKKLAKYYDNNELKKLLVLNPSKIILKK